MFVAVNEESPAARALYRDTWLSKPGDPKQGGGGGQKREAHHYRFFISKNRGMIDGNDVRAGDTIEWPRSLAREGASESQARDSVRIWQMRWIIKHVEFRYLLVLELGQSRYGTGDQGGPTRPDPDGPPIL